MIRLALTAVLSACVLYQAAAAECAQKSDFVERGFCISSPDAPRDSGFSYDPKYDRLIDSYAQAANIDPYLVRCIIKVESDYNPNAVSVAGAAGLMQLMQETARQYGCTTRTDPESNIRAGVAHLSYLLRLFYGDVSLALAAYHAGGTRVSKNMSVPYIRTTVDYVNVIMYYYTGQSDYIRRYNKMQRSADVPQRGL